MKKRVIAAAATCGFLVAICVGTPDRLMAQAAPGPITPSPSQIPPARPVASRPKPPEVQPRTSLDGAWKLNRDESDDPRSKTQDSSGQSGNGGGRNPGGGGYPGGGYPGGGYPGGGYPGGGGGGYPGGGGPYGGGRRNGEQNAENNEKIQEVIRPADSLTFALKTPEVDVTDDQSHKLAFFTDKRQLQKPKDDSYREIAAHWDGSRLVSDEKSPQGGKMSRTFELSYDGKQLYESINLDRGKSGKPVYVRYVYDIPGAQTAKAAREIDPNQPVLKRRADNSDNASSPASGSQGTQADQGSDPDQPVLVRHDDSANGTTSPSTTQSSEPDNDPNKPVLKRHSGDTNNFSQ